VADKSLCSSEEELVRDRSGLELTKILLNRDSQYLSDLDVPDNERMKQIKKFVQSLESTDNDSPLKALAKTIIQNLKKSHHFHQLQQPPNDLDKKPYHP
jgi:hypothetical protein